MYPRNTRWIWLAGIAVFGGLVAAASRATARPVADADMPAKADSTTLAESLSVAFEQVAKKVTPCVVSIKSVRKVQMIESPGLSQSPLLNSPLRRFFGDEFFEFFSQPQAPHDFVQQGLGTGVIVSRDGYILTNNHVIDGADQVTVKLSDDRTLQAKVVGTDPKTDLAVLKVDAKDLVPAELGDSDHLKVGEWVVAVGDPFGLTSTITAGIVSAKGRAHVGIADYEDFIQTDAAINPGNSGGPLVNLRGEVIGINTAIATRNGGYMGVGFAVPANMAKLIMKSLIDEGRVVRGYLGIIIQDLTEELAKSFGYESTKGALVADIAEDGPAAKAGMKTGDIIVDFDGQDVPNMDQFRAMVATTKPGTKVPLEVFRNGRREKLHVKVGELETDENTLPNAPSAPLDLGMTVRTITAEIAQQLGYSEDVAGVVVTGVEPFGPAARAGLQVKDVIESVQGATIHNVDEFRRALHKSDLRQGVRLGVRTGGLRRFVFLQMDKTDASR